jgi:hypothetical protein
MAERLPTSFWYSRLSKTRRLLQINLTRSSKNISRDKTKPVALIDYLPVLQRNTQTPFAGYLAVESSDKFNSNKKQS